MRRKNMARLANGWCLCSQRWTILTSVRLPIPEPEGQPLEFPPVLECLLDMLGRDLATTMPLQRDHLEGVCVDGDEIRPAEDHQQVRSGIGTHSAQLQQLLAQFQSG